MTTINDTLKRVTDRIAERSHKDRGVYLSRMEQAAADGPTRGHLSCSAQAHAYAGAGEDQDALATGTAGNLGIVTAYNDMLSAHQPFERFPDLIRKAARDVGGTAQVAGGVPAMCDGVTQGYAGMELSL
ncbi:MAG: dihydroxy-acid dehydratase, partial [Pseudomonadota bacterium]